MKDDVLHGRVRVFFAHAHGLSWVPATPGFDWLACVIWSLLANQSDDLHVMQRVVANPGGPAKQAVTNGRVRR